MNAGEVYYVKKDSSQEKNSTGHWWILLNIDDHVVRYITTTSNIDDFIYKKELFGPLCKPNFNPDQAIFLNIHNMSNFNFTTDTMINLRHRYSEIKKIDFIAKINDLDAKLIAKLPGRYLAKIIPCIKCVDGTKNWNKHYITQILGNHEEGLQKEIDNFYKQL